MPTRPRTRAVFLAVVLLLGAFLVIGLASSFELIACAAVS